MRLLVLFFILCPLEIKTISDFKKKETSVTYDIAFDKAEAHFLCTNEFILQLKTFSLHNSEISCNDSYLRIEYNVLYPNESKAHHFANGYIRENGGCILFTQKKSEVCRKIKR